MRKLRKITFLAFLFILPSIPLVNAQQVRVKATIDSTDILIGQQTLIKLEITQPKETLLNFPVHKVNEKLTDGIEIVAISKADTFSLKNDHITIRQDYLITSFDSGSYTIPPFKFETLDEEYHTNSLNLEVHTIQLEEEGEIRDIKPLYEPPFNWLRLIGILLLTLLALALIGGLIYFIIQKKKNKPLPFFDKKEIKPLPHEVALQKLNKIKEEKIWQKGQDKLYYTQLTDALREYLGERFEIPAMEMTSAEILMALRNNDDAKVVLDKLKQIFAISDMVKFAKQQPTTEENELSIVNAFFVVNQTMILPVTPSEEEIKSMKEEERKEIDKLTNE